MGSTYIIEPDPDNFDHLHEPWGLELDSWWPEHGIESLADLTLAFDGAPLSPRWKPLPVEHAPARKRRNRGQAVDFPWFSVASLAMSGRALEVTAPLVGRAVEALALDCVDHPERRYYALNFLDLVDCLDEARSEITRTESGHISTIRRHAFKPGTTEGHHLFRLRQRPMGETLASSAFKSLVESAGLVGLIFRPVSEDSPVSRPPAAGPTAPGRRR